MHNRKSGQPLLQFSGNPAGPIIHMDSGAVYRGRVYTAHSNYDDSPMTSSIEVFDARTLQHIGSHSIGVDPGALTRLGPHDNGWAAGVAQHHRVAGRPTAPHAATHTTQILH